MRVYDRAVMRAGLPLSSLRADADSSCPSAAPSAALALLVAAAILLSVAAPHPAAATDDPIEAALQNASGAADQDATLPTPRTTQPPLPTPMPTATDTPTATATPTPTPSAADGTAGTAAFPNETGTPERDAATGNGTPATANGSESSGGSGGFLPTIDLSGGLNPIAAAVLLVLFMVAVVAASVVYLRKDRSRGGVVESDGDPNR